MLLAVLLDLGDVGDRDTHQEVHDDQTEHEDEEDEGDVGRDGELGEDVHLADVCSIVGQFSGELQVRVFNLPRHLDQDAHNRPREIVDIHRSFPRKQNDEHHHEANSHSEVRKREPKHVLRNSPKY